MASPEARRSPAEQRSGYEFVCDLAEGGMGVVELVARRDGRFERLYARKRLHVQYRNDSGFQAMFMDEARLAGLLRHPNIVSVLDIGEDAGGPFLILDYVEGVPLVALLKHAQREQRLLPLQICVRIVADAARGLHAAHEARGADGEPLGIVHRDVSANNILVGFDGSVRVTDFGIAKALGNVTHTSTGVLKGNRAYLSPEQLRFEPIDRRSDLFSLGIVLHELLAGEQLYGGDMETAARRILTEPPPDIAQQRTDVPADVSELLFELLAKAREARPATAGEVAARLDRIAVQLAAEDDELLEVGAYMNASFAELRHQRKEAIAAGLSARAASDSSAGTRVETTRGRSRRHRRLVAAIAAGMAALSVAGVLWTRGRSREAAVAGGSGLAVWAGGWHTCAGEREKLWCWGKNNEGQLGDGTTVDGHTPRPVKLDGPVVALALGQFHTCACRTDGRVFCWGMNEDGQLGTGTTAPALAPAPVAGLPACSGIAAGGRHSCALAGGRAFCWGANDKGQLGAERPARLPPTEVPGLGAVVSLDADSDFTCAVRPDGAVLCFGDNTAGQLGGGGAGGFRAAPAAVEAVADAVEIALGRQTACARLRSGRVRCWGKKGDEKVDVPEHHLLAPVELPGVRDGARIGVGGTHVCVLSRDGRLGCLWANFFGQLGDGTKRTFREEPVAPLGLDRVTGLGVGEVHVCAAHAHGVSCWGGNFTGQVGDPTKDERPRPVSVVGLAR